MLVPFRALPNTNSDDSLCDVVGFLFKLIAALITLHVNNNKRFGIK